MAIEECNDSLLVPATIHEQLADKDFDDGQYIHVLDVSVIATGFGQLMDEGQIELDAKPLIQRAIKRQLLWSNLGGILVPYQAEDRDKLRVLSRILREAYISTDPADLGATVSSAADSRGHTTARLAGAPRQASRTHARTDFPALTARHRAGPGTWSYYPNRGGWTTRSAVSYTVLTEVRVLSY